MNTLPWMAPVLGLLLILSPSARALDLNEELSNVRILDVHPDNIVVLNRGGEDGVWVGNHARLKGAEGYAARAICVKSGLLTSHWRLYRIVDNQRVSRDLTYTLVGMEDSESTKEMSRVRSSDLAERLPEFDESRLEPKAEVKSDLPETLVRDKRYLDSLKTKQTLFLERTFDKERMKRDFRVIKGSLYASPFSVQKGPNNVQNYLYGATVANQGKRYLGQLGFDKVSLRASEEKSGQDIVNDATTVNGRFVIKDISPAWDAFSDVTWRQARYGSDYAPRSHYLIAPLGFAWRREAGPQLKRFEIGYAPTYDARTHESREQNRSYDNSDSQGLRHALHMRLSYDVTPDFTIRNEFFYRPRQDLSALTFDLADNLAQNTFEASWRIWNRWFAAYEFRWLDDAQLRRLNRMTRVVTINSFNVRYDFEL